MDDGAQERRRVAIRPGLTVPYPQPSSAAATTIGKANVRTSTAPELALRRELHRRGSRYRVDYAVRAGLPRAVKVDIAFTRARLAVFVDGCFWHRCPLHGSSPKSNTDYWGPKLEANVDRDARVTAALEQHGWRVIRAWEHVPPSDVADRIESAYRRTKR